MITYIKQWPKDREMGWSEEVNGVCHDADNWFFTQNGNLWKFPITHDLNAKCTAPDKSRGIYRTDLWNYMSNNKRGNLREVHMGDIDTFGKYVFVPVVTQYTIVTGFSPSDVKTSKYASICVFRTSDLSFVKELKVVREDGKPFTSLPWLAINSNFGLLYTSDRDASDTTENNHSRIHIYFIGDIYKSDTLTLYGTAVLKDQYGMPLYREYMQGGTFYSNLRADKIFLITSNGYVTHNQGKDVSWANSKGGISVFQTANLPNGGSNNNMYRVTYSGQNKSDAFRYQFDGWGNEPQGLTDWDLDSDKRAPGMEGQLHAIMLDNTGTGADDFFFKHYKIDTYVGFYRFIVKTPKDKFIKSSARIFISILIAISDKTITLGEQELLHPQGIMGNNESQVIIEYPLRKAGMTHLSIRSDYGGKSPDCYIGEIIVHDMNEEKYYRFPCNKLFSKTTSLVYRIEGSMIDSQSVLKLGLN